ncbi:MAG: L-threonylcarbamoyladenylate synthase [Anaerolineae bacterium]
MIEKPEYTTLTLPASSQEALERAADLLRQGMVVAFPTDTVYGVGCDLWQPEAIERLILAKRRPYEMAIPVLVANLAAVHQVAQNLGEVFEILAQRFWPGELTLIVSRRKAVPDLLCAGGPTVAVRMPNHAMLLHLLEMLSGALAVTSANLSGHSSPCTPDQVCEQLCGRIPLILDGGRCSGGMASTIIDCVSRPPILLRAGNLSLDIIRTVLPEIVEKK